MKHIVEIVLPGITKLFGMELPKGAIIRNCAAKKTNGQFGDIKLIGAIWIEVDPLETQAENRTFGWVAPGELIGGKMGYEAVYIGSGFTDKTYFLYEYPTIQFSEEVAASFDMDPKKIILN